MSCTFDREKLTALLDGVLSVEERPGVEQHISSCSECLRALGEEKSVAALVHALPRRPVPAAVTEGIRQGIRQAEVRVTKLATYRRLTAVVAAAAAVVLVVVTINLLDRGTGLPQADSRTAMAESKFREEGDLGKDEQKLNSLTDDESLRRKRDEAASLKERSVAEAASTTPFGAPSATEPKPLADVDSSALAAAAAPEDGRSESAPTESPAATLPAPSLEEEKKFHIPEVETITAYVVTVENVDAARRQLTNLVALKKLTLTTGIGMDRQTEAALTKAVHIECTEAESDELLAQLASNTGERRARSQGGYVQIEPIGAVDGKFGKVQEQRKTAGRTDQRIELERELTQAGLILDENADKALALAQKTKAIEGGGKDENEADRLDESKQMEALAEAAEESSERSRAVPETAAGGGASGENKDRAFKGATAESQPDARGLPGAPAPRRVRLILIFEPKVVK